MALRNIGPPKSRHPALGSSSARPRILADCVTVRIAPCPVITQRGGRILGGVDAIPKGGLEPDWWLFQRLCAGERQDRLELERAAPPEARTLAPKGRLSQ